MLRRIPILMMVLLLLAGISSQALAAPAPIDSVGISSSLGGGTVAVKSSDLNTEIMSSGLVGVTQVDFQDDGDLVVGTSDAGGYVYLYDGMDAGLVQAAIATGGAPTKLEVSNSGNIAYAVGGTVTIQSSDGGTQIGTRSLPADINDMYFRPDGDLAVVTGSELYVLDGLDSGLTTLASTTYATGLMTVAVQSDNSVVAAGPGGLFKFDPTLTTAITEKAWAVGQYMRDLAIQSDDDIVIGCSYNGGTVAIFDPSFSTEKIANYNMLGDILALDIQSNDDIVVLNTYHVGLIRIYDEDDVSPAGEKAYQYADGAHDIAISTVPKIPGDTNLDGNVDGDDAATLASNWQAVDADWSMGDFNHDGVVDDIDATLLATNWQSPTNSAVPEPSTIMLIIGGLISLAACYYHKRK